LNVATFKGSIECKTFIYLCTSMYGHAYKPAYTYILTYKHTVYNFKYLWSKDFGDPLLFNELKVSNLSLERKIYVLISENFKLQKFGGKLHCCMHYFMLTFI